MSDHVDADKIEQIVGLPRHQHMHFARAVSVEQRVYVLHSAVCRASTPDLRDCEYSVALDRGIDKKLWRHWWDVPVFAGIHHRRLVPIGEWTPAGRAGDSRA